MIHKADSLKDFKKGGVVAASSSFVIFTKNVLFLEKTCKDYCC